MNTVLEGSPGEPTPRHATYLDDVHLGGNRIGSVSTGGVGEPGCWPDTLLALKRLTDAGFPISIKKCRFLIKELDVLGMVLFLDKY